MDFYLTNSNSLDGISGDGFGVPDVVAVVVDVVLQTFCTRSKPVCVFKRKRKRPETRIESMISACVDQASD